MNAYYEDILSKLGEPLWWDENAVPRYCEFSPDKCADIYAREVALVEIACQGCDTHFKVAASMNDMQRWMGENELSLHGEITARSIGFGDPPNNHCCAAGPTMTSNTIRVLEYWHRDIKDMSKTFEFVRDNQYEIEIDGETNDTDRNKWIEQLSQIESEEEGDKNENGL